MDNQRYKRVRQVLKKLNKTRHAQAKKIDILCNDMVSAHSDFVKQLQSLNFCVDFYESILGCGDSISLLNTAAKIIKNHVVDSNIALFLIETDGFAVHMADENKPIDIDTEKLEDYFTPEVVQNICRSNWICTLDDMYEMGLQGNLSDLNKISAAALPLKRLGPPIGFILIYRSVDHKLTGEELEKLTTVVSGLSYAIEAQQISHQTLDSDQQ